MGEKEYNEKIRVANKQEVRMIEREYIGEVLGGLEAAIEERRADLERKLIEYSEKYTKTMYTKDGDPYEVPNVNPMIIKKYFFQSINPLMNREPEYSAEKLGIIWGLYEEMVTEINARIGIFVPSVSHFCSFAGMRVETFKRLRGSYDEDMRIVIDKIEDGCYDANVMMSQMGYVKERSTVYRMKSEQERVEKEAITSVTVVNNKVDLDEMKAKLAAAKKMQAFGEKKKAIEVELIDEPRAGEEN